jgi:hypothetical protein
MKNLTLIFYVKLRINFEFYKNFKSIKGISSILTFVQCKILMSEVNCIKLKVQEDKMKSFFDFEMASQNT